MIDVDVHEAEVILLEGALALSGSFRNTLCPTVQALGLEDAPDAVAIEVRQEVADNKGQIIEAKLVARRTAQTMARSSSVAFHGSRCGLAEWSRQSCAPRLRHLQMVSVLTP